MQKKPTHKNPPLIRTKLQPEDIIPEELMVAFVKHYKVSLEGGNLDQFSAAIRNDIGKAYKKLRANGYLPVGLDDRGRIKWAVITNTMHKTMGEESFLYPEDLLETKGI